jgi:proline dehydrogenase
MSILTYFARAFVAGERVNDAVKVVRRLNQKGIMATLDILGENVKDARMAESAVNAYIELLDVIAKEGINSWKVPSIPKRPLNYSKKFLKITKM